MYFSLAICLQVAADGIADQCNEHLGYDFISAA
jgi:hypothetical protein